MRYRLRKGPTKKCDVCEEVLSMRSGAVHKIKHAEMARVTSDDGCDLCWGHYNERVRPR